MKDQTKRQRLAKLQAAAERLSLIPKIPKTGIRRYMQRFNTMPAREVR